MLVYGRLKNSSMDSSLKHLVLLSMINQVIGMIKISSHKKVEHGGRGYTIKLPRNSGFWMINANSACRSIFFLICCLPKITLQIGRRISIIYLLRFRYVQNFYNQRRKAVLKRYRTIFTCMATRTVYLEVCNSMETNSITQILRKFIGRRSNIRIIRSENSSNFLGVEKEQLKAFQEMHHNEMKS